MKSPSSASKNVLDSHRGPAATLKCSALPWSHIRVPRCLGRTGAHWWGMWFLLTHFFEAKWALQRKIWKKKIRSTLPTSKYIAVTLRSSIDQPVPTTRTGCWWFLVVNSLSTQYSWCVFSFQKRKLSGWLLVVRHCMFSCLPFGLSMPCRTSHLHSQKGTGSPVDKFVLLFQEHSKELEPSETSHSTPSCCAATLLTPETQLPAQLEPFECQPKQEIA